MSPRDDACDPEATACFPRCAETTAWGGVFFLSFYISHFLIRSLLLTAISFFANIYHCIAAYSFQPYSPPIRSPPASLASRSISFRREGGNGLQVRATLRSSARVRARECTRKSESGGFSPAAGELFSLCFRPDPSCLDKSLSREEGKRKARWRGSSSSNAGGGGGLGLTCLSDRLQAVRPSGAPGPYRADKEKL